MTIVIGILIYLVVTNKKQNDEQELGSITVANDNNDEKLKDVELLDESEIEAVENQREEQWRELGTKADYIYDLSDTSASEIAIDDSFADYCISADGYVYYNLIKNLAAKYNTDTNNVVLDNFDYEETTDMYFYQISISGINLRVYIDNNDMAYIMEQ
ncbi:MAG: hypothetical protein E7272_07815 [Pseudobutyrivibrio ruminis]|uniref:Uncharacterized protein n=1 Tax=Pseudobutyrivibrio ruminis TaxID=46206 RepID=A0A927UBC3_9FIRM|nr:hypothetical protein [Pseudobutyrivibrio ruminis]